jgi:1-acyl-sn-glycerol-3-phosphate acyltransferase
MTDKLQTTSDKMHWRDSVTWYTQETPFMRIIQFLAKPFFYALAQVDHEGFDNVPLKGPCVVAANHISNLDTIYMGASLPRYPHFMAKRELYKNPFFAWFIRQLGSFPVNRGESDPWALKQAGRILDAGQILFMFPEGTRSGRKAKMKRAKVGAVKLALEHRAPIVPAAIWGTQDFHFGLRQNNKISIRVGQPLDVVAMAGSPPYNQKTYRELTTVLMQQIAAMLPPTHRGVYG